MREGDGEENVKKNYLLLEIVKIRIIPRNIFFY